jgi:hypothetical protein
MAELLENVALREGALCSIWLHLDGNVAELGSWKISWDFAVLGKVTRKRGRFNILGSSGGDRRVVVICLKLITSKPRLTNPSQISFAGVLYGRWRITAFMGLSAFK